MNSTHQNRRILVSLAVALALGATVALSGQSSWTAPRTPWGDPDLQGTYTNSNESGIPLEKPAEFAGKRQEDITPADLDRLVKERAARQQKTAQTIGGATDNDTGAGPPHW
jgi:hypothetical protein